MRVACRLRFRAVAFCFGLRICFCPCFRFCIWRVCRIFCLSCFDLNHLCLCRFRFWFCFFRLCFDFLIRTRIFRFLLFRCGRL